MAPVEGALGVWSPEPSAKGCPVPVRPEQELGLLWSSFTPVSAARWTHSFPVSLILLISVIYRISSGHTECSFLIFVADVY